MAKIWADHNLKPWKVATLKVSNDRHFEDKLVDVVGLYLNPPARVVANTIRDRNANPAALVRRRPQPWGRPHAPATRTDVEVVMPGPAVRR
ncbi:hypothetical protein [Mycolicibacter kumamotonensis]|uniref:hypothetical protein n=1 Tax=Mycolicibacter kumamotonensis TaxID=354243 RepID=UPI000A747D00